jgi:phosphoglycolate phosphatase-like HAD superfamily hydrolase
MGIVTRNTRENALRILEIIGIDRFFPAEAVVGRDEAEPKPSAEGILQLAARWGIAAERMVMVGDYLYDLEAGRRAGTLTVHLERSKAPRWPHLADLVVPDLEYLAEVIGS